MSNEERQRLNAERLLKIDVSIRNKVAAVLRDLEANGEKPLIAPEVWRDPVLQRKLYREGKSHVTWGYHCNTVNGKPASLAADIVDSDRGWNAKRSFWLKLASSALSHDLHWGGFWGLPQSVRKGLYDTIKARHWDQPVKLGWDAAHIEVSGITIAEARAKSS